MPVLRRESERKPGKERERESQRKSAQESLPSGPWVPCSWSRSWCLGSSCCVLSLWHLRYLVLLTPSPLQLSGFSSCTPTVRKNFPMVTGGQSQAAS